MAITKRNFLTTAAGATLALPALAYARAASQFVTRPALLPDSYKVGQMPSLPPLSNRPNPPGFYLFADGYIELISGFCGALRLTTIERAGYARRIPYGVDVTTDAKKLWFLGRESFAPRITSEIIATFPGMGCFYKRGLDEERKQLG